MLHIREGVSFFFGFWTAESEKALAEVIQTGEEHHADEHGHIIARTHRSVGKQTQTQRFCDAVGDQGSLNKYNQAILAFFNQR